MTPNDSLRLFPPYLDAGSSGAAVIWLKQWLISMGLEKNLLPLNDQYNDDTVSAVKKLQRDILLMAEPGIDGNFGPATRAAMRSDGENNFDIIPARQGDRTWWIQDGQAKGVWPNSFIIDV